MLIIAVIEPSYIYCPVFLRVHAAVSVTLDKIYDDNAIDNYFDNR